MRKVSARRAERIVTAWPVTAVSPTYGGSRGRLSPCRRLMINQDRGRPGIYIHRRRDRAWQVIAEAPSRSAASISALFHLDPHAFGSDDPDEPTITRWWRALAHRHAVLGRFWPADHLPEPRRLPAPGEALVKGDTAWVRIAAEGVDDLAAGVEAMGAWVSAAQPGVRQVVYVHGAVCMLDLCPTPLAQAARAAARAAAQDIGEAASRGEPIPAGWWAATDGAALLAAARRPGGCGTTLERALPDHVARLSALKMRGPDPAPALPAPAAFVEAWSAGDALVFDRAGRVRPRAGAGGRPRKVPLARYVRARLAVEARGGTPNDAAVTRELCAAGAEITRTTVRLLRQTFEHLDETALAELDAELRAAGLDAIGATAVPEGLHPGDGPGVVFPYIGSKKRLLDLVVARLPAGELDYVEPCFGAGTIGLHLLAEDRVRRAVFGDADPDLIHCWRWIQRDPVGVFETAASYPWDKATFYRVRGTRERPGKFDALTGLARAGAFFYLMWRGYNGMLRRNGSGGFNMPAGRRPGIGCSLERLVEASRLLQGVTFACGDVEDVVAYALGQPGAGPWTAYIDPPYWPTSKTSSFAGYGGGCQAGDQARFVAAGRRVADAGGVAVLSNASSAPVLALCADAELVWVSVWRSVNCKKELRGGACEVLARFA